MASVPFLHKKPKNESAASLQMESRKNRAAVRWYVLSLPSVHKGPARGLQEELDRRLRNGEPGFEFFAPTCVEMKEVNGTLVKTDAPLLYNYVFIRASETEIFKIKRVLPRYNLLPRIKDRRYGYYPYVSDETMENLQRAAKSYAGLLPVYTPGPERLLKGDRVRITDGQFKGAEASVIGHPGTKRKEVMVCVDNWMWVPLLRVRSGQYEVIALNDTGRHIYACLDNDRLSSGLHEALKRRRSPEGTTVKDRALALETLKQFENLEMGSNVMRSKLYSFLLMAHTVLGNREAGERLAAMILGMLPLVRAELSQALLLVTLYGCTGNGAYRIRAHEIVDSWEEDMPLRKNKSLLRQRLADYDRWLTDENSETEIC